MQNGIQVLNPINMNKAIKIQISNKDIDPEKVYTINIFFENDKAYCSRPPAESVAHNETYEKLLLIFKQCQIDIFK